VATAEGTSGTRGGGGGVSEEFANRRRYDNEGDIELAAVIRSTMNAAKTKSSHIITGKKPPEKEQRLANGPDDDEDDAGGEGGQDTHDVRVPPRADAESERSVYRVEQKKWR